MIKNKKMNAIIIDDDKMARAIIIQLTSLFSKIKIVKEFSNAINAIKYLNQNQVDLVFLDIHMPNFSGIDFIQTIKNPPQIILVTADKNFAIDAYEYNCIIDYLVKPISEERFEKTINKLKYVNVEDNNEIRITEQKVINPSEEFFVNIDRRLIKIEYATVNVIEARGDYIYIKTDKENYKVHTTLKKIEEKLPQHLFLKVHRSFIINFKKIIDIEDNSVLISKYVIPVSRSNRKELINLLNLV
jgi:two-component system response regulator LytT